MAASPLMTASPLLAASFDNASPEYRYEVMQFLFDRLRFVDGHLQGVGGMPACWTYEANWPLPPGEARLSARKVWAMTKILTAWLRDNFGDPSDLETERSWCYRMRGWHSASMPGGLDLYFCAQADAAKFRLFFDVRPWRDMRRDI